MYGKGLRVRGDTILNDGKIIAQVAVSNSLYLWIANTIFVVYYDDNTDDAYKDMLAAFCLEDSV